MTSPRNHASVAHPERDRDKAVEICVAAARIFSEKGFHATSINEVADAVHLTKAGLYYYIKGKQDLLYRIMELAMDTLEQEVVDTSRDEDDLVDRLRTIVERYTRLIIEGRYELRVLVNEIEGLTESQRSHIVARQREFMRYIRRTLDALAAEGKLRDVDSTVGAYGLSGMILWVSRWYRPGGRLDVDQLVENITRIALSGVLEGEGEPAAGTGRRPAKAASGPRSTKPPTQKSRESREKA